MSAFNVWLGTKLIDTVFFSIYGTITERIDYVKRALIGHDGYDPEIKVTWPKGQRITRTHFDLMGDYGQGFEVLTSAYTWREIKQNKKEYQENSPCPMKIIKRREKV